MEEEEYLSQYEKRLQDSLVKLGTEAAVAWAGFLGMAIAALTMIRHEHIEPASPRAYYIFARTVQILYRTGASIELFLQGYKLEKLTM